MHEDQRVKNLKSIPLIIFAVTMMVTGQILEKKGIGVVKDAAGEDFTFFANIFAIIFNPYVLVGIVVYVVSAVVWLMILSKADLSFAYPFLAISYVAIIIVSPIALPGEPWPDFWKVLAVLLIISGVLAMAQGERVRERKTKTGRTGE